MKRKILPLLVLCAGFAYGQQSFSGIRTGAYAGLPQLLSNPANVVGNARTWDVNLVSFDAGTLNNKVEISLKAAKSFEDYTLKSLASENNMNVSLGADLLGPSFFYSPKSGSYGVALISRARNFTIAREIDANLFTATLFEPNNMRLPYTLSIDNQGVSTNAFAELGLTYGRLLFSAKGHSLKAALSVKYVQGLLSNSIEIENFQGHLDRNRYGNIEATGRGSISGLSSYGAYDDFKVKPNASGVAFDFGVVYEYKPEEYTRPYKVKVGVALTDLGKLKYEASQESYKYAFANQVIDLDNIRESLEKGSLSVKTSLEGEKFETSLPKALRFNADYNILGGLYLDASAQINLVDKKGANTYYSNSYVFTPRYETKVFGAYLPVTIDDVAGINAGMALRVGPLYFGSSTVFTNLAENGKALNVFLGLRFGR